MKYIISVSNSYRNDNEKNLIAWKTCHHELKYEIIYTETKAHLPEGNILLFFYKLLIGTMLEDINFADFSPKLY